MGIKLSQLFFDSAQELLKEEKEHFDLMWKRSPNGISYNPDAEPYKQFKKSSELAAVFTAMSRVHKKFEEQMDHE